MLTDIIDIKMRIMIFRPYTVGQSFRLCNLSLFQDPPDNSMNRQVYDLWYTFKIVLEKCFIIILLYLTCRKFTLLIIDYLKIYI